MADNKYSKATQSVHAGSHGDPLFKGTVTPVYPSSAYDYEDVPETLYPRYFNTPNQRACVEKLCALEHAEDGMMFSSGMAAILTAIFAFVRSGDHVLLQSDLYGGTHHAIVNELPRYGIEYSFVDGTRPGEFQRELRKNTRLVYIETPSNPTLRLTDLEAVAAFARERGLLTVIDNTFASPINQNPIDFGIDIVAHSGTKYIGGHSDLSCGAVLSSKENMRHVHHTALHFGGNLDAAACWLVERSLKTIALRVRQQNANALSIARFLAEHPAVSAVHYPGLTTHPQHALAVRQMKGGFGGMLSFEVKGDPDAFMRRLSLIRRAISLGGVESTITSPVKTSHSKMSPADRRAIGVSDNLVRLSVGIEEVDDLIEDLSTAFS